MGSIFLSSLVGQYVAGLGLLFWLARRKEDGDLGFNIQGGDFGYIGVGLVLQLSVALLVLPLSNLLFPDGRPEQSVAASLMEAESFPVRVTLVVAYVVVGPVVEELIYRGVLLRALESRGRWTAIIGSSVVFAAIHLPGLETDQPVRSAAVFLPPFIVLGVVLAWLTIRKGRLGPAIFVHSGWNLLAALVLLIPSDILNQVG
jgi:membrane protease YdiL (CAAX protease family)